MDINQLAGKYEISDPGIDGAENMNYPLKYEITVSQDDTGTYHIGDSISTETETGSDFIQIVDNNDGTYNLSYDEFGDGSLQAFDGIDEDLLTNYLNYLLSLDYATKIDEPVESEEEAHTELTEDDKSVDVRTLKENKNKIHYTKVTKVNGQDVTYSQLSSEHTQVGDSYYGYAYFETSKGPSYYPTDLNGYLVDDSTIWKFMKGKLPKITTDSTELTEDNNKSVDVRTLKRQIREEIHALEDEYKDLKDNLVRSFANDMRNEAVKVYNEQIARSTNIDEVKTAEREIKRILENGRSSIYDHLDEIEKFGESRHQKLTEETDGIKPINKDEEDMIVERIKHYGVDVIGTRREDSYFVVECDNTNQVLLGDLLQTLRSLEDSHDIGYIRESNDNGFYGYDFKFFRYDDEETLTENKKMLKESIQDITYNEKLIQKLKQTFSNKFEFQTEEEFLDCQSEDNPLTEVGIIGILDPNNFVDIFHTTNNYIINIYFTEQRKEKIHNMKENKEVKTEAELIDFLEFIGFTRK